MCTGIGHGSHMILVSITCGYVLHVCADVCHGWCIGYWWMSPVTVFAMQVLVMAHVHNIGERHMWLCSQFVCRCWDIGEHHLWLFSLFVCRCWSWLTHTISVNITCGYVHYLYAGAGHGSHVRYWWTSPVAMFSICMQVLVMTHIHNIWTSHVAMFAICMQVLVVAHMYDSGELHLWLCSLFVCRCWLWLIYIYDIGECHLWLCLPCVCRC